MERVFANLYRVDGRNKRGVSHTYFLKRRAGNALVSHQAPLDAGDLDEIEALGGLDSMWVCHSHDLMQGEIHQALHDRFGADLHHHRIDRPRVRKKTKCPTAEFEGEGTREGADFEAHFLPTCTAGHSVYRWKCRGKYHLFTSHAIYYRGGQWELGFNETHREAWSAQLSALAGLHVDYLFPGYTAPEEESYYRLDDGMRAAFVEACQSKGRPLPGPSEMVLPGPAKGLRLDGDPDGPAWRGVPPLELTGRDGTPAPLRTTARIAWTASHLWVAVVCHEPAMDRLTVDADADRPAREPEIWKDDMIDLLVCPDEQDRRRLHQIIVNAAGASVTGSCERGFKPAWGGPVETRVAAAKDRWTAVLRVPFAELGISRPAGRSVALNLYRNRRCGDSPVFSCWSVPGGRPRLARERFGRVTFGTA